MSERIEDTVNCPVCSARVGERCVTWIDGIDVGWTHDARYYLFLAATQLPVADRQRGTEK